MNTTLIDQFLNAVIQWSKRTGQDTFGIMIMSFGHIGAIHYFAERRKKNLSGEFDFRAYLITVLERSNISQSLLISGLITMIDIHLTQLAKDYKSWLENMQNSANLMEYMANNPEYLNRLLHEFNQERLSQGQEPLAFNDPKHLLRAADYYRSKINDVDDNEAERKMQLLAWREIVIPLLDFDKLWPVMKQDIDSLPKYLDD